MREVLVPASRSRASQNNPQNQLQISPLRGYSREELPPWQGEEKGFIQHRDTALETPNDGGEMGRNRQ